MPVLAESQIEKGLDGRMVIGIGMRVLVHGAVRSDQV
jgi:hypothetical protein